MSRVCELTGKGPMSGNNVSHANNKTRRRFLPNLNDVTLQSETLGRGVKLRISAAALRSVDHRGGLDAYLAKAKDVELSDRARKVKKEIAKAQTAACAFSLRRIKIDPVGPGRRGFSVRVPNSGTRLVATSTDSAEPAWISSGRPPTVMVPVASICSGRF